MPCQPVVPHLSKSRFMAGLQCHKRLWLVLFQPEEAVEPDAATPARFDQGIRVGEVARGYVPGGTLVSESREELAAALRRTQGLLRDEAVPAIYEATFSHEQVPIRADILRRGRGSAFDLRAAGTLPSLPQSGRSSYRPFHFGARFSAYARGPSWASSLA